MNQKLLRNTIATWSLCCASERWQQGDDLTAFNEELIYRETAAHELYKVTDMNDHKPPLSTTTQVNQSSIQTNVIQLYTSTLIT